jgi:multiple sugar transport system substrate-binding protein
MSARRNFLMIAIVSLSVLLTAAVSAQDGNVIFISTQFNVVEEADKARGILANFEGGTIEFVTSEEGPMIDLLRAESDAGTGANDVVGALHGTFPTLAGEDLMFDLTDLLAEIEAENDVNDAFVELGKMGTEDYQYYIPWMQATYIMAAHKDALQYLPEGADLNALTWEQVSQWAQAMQEATGSPQLGLPVAGLFNRFMQGSLFPSFTGGMVTKFKSPEAVEAMRFLRDDLWPYVNPESINYDFMNEPLLAGQVMVAWDHVARLKPAFDERPDDFVAFPTPAGPAGRGYMPVVVGLGIPFTAAHPEEAEAVIKFMLSPETQGAILSELGFYPVIGGVETEDLPAGVAIELAAVQAQLAAEDSVVALLPVGLGARGGEINEIFRNPFTRIVLEGQDIETVLNEEAATLQTLMDETGAACWSPDPASEGPCQVE